MKSDTKYFNSTKNKHLERLYKLEVTQYIPHTNLHKKGHRISEESHRNKLPKGLRTPEKRVLKN